MRVFKTRNVQSAMFAAGPWIRHVGQVEETRNGPALVAPEPVTTVYLRPTERVVLWEPRAANPFFHLFEAMWMLGGCQDAAFLDRYVKNFGARYAESDGNLHGAYGYRWRRHFRDPANDRGVEWGGEPDQLAGVAKLDQLAQAAQMLRLDRNTRRVVVSMWDPISDLDVDRRDIPCNTQLMFRGMPDGSLDMTVTCRSNDVVWGAYGANAVHMSIIHEWMAWAAGFHVGVYRQVSNNFHAYKDTLRMLPEKSMEAMGWREPYATGTVAPSPMFLDQPDVGTLDYRIQMWLSDPSAYGSWHMGMVHYGRLFSDLLIPMSRAHDAIKGRDWRAAENELLAVRPSDWRLAGSQFLHRRMERAGLSEASGDE